MKPGNLIFYAILSVAALFCLGCIFYPPRESAWVDYGVYATRVSTRPAVTPIPIPVHVPIVSTQALLGSQDVIGSTITIRYSRYDPSLGGPNCFSFVGGVCISNMASGKPWAPYMESACACVPEWPFGTIVIVDGKRWTCLDRGGMIKTINGVPWVDFLTRYPLYAYRTLVEAVVVFP